MIDPTFVIHLINDTSAETLDVHTKLRARATRVRELRSFAAWLLQGNQVPPTGPGFDGAWTITLRGLERHSSLVYAVNEALVGDLDRLRALVSTLLARTTR